MGYIVRMPKLGVEMEVGKVIEWHADEGDAVEEGDVVAEIESEKSVAEVAAREAGVLRIIYLDTGAEAPPGGAMGIVADPDEDISDLEDEVDVPSEESSEETGDEAEAETSGSEPTSATTRASEPAQSASGVKATPKAKKTAEELGVSLASITGTGPEGGITASDVEASAAETGAAKRTVREERELSGMRSTIADRLGQSYREAVHVTVDRIVDVEPVYEALEDVDVSLTDVIIRCVSETLEDHPEFNATYDAEAETLTLYEEHNVGVAIDLDGGLVTPVIPNTDEMSVGEINAARGRVTDRVLDGEYTSDDLSGGTFTVSNLGVFGSDSFTPIINPPEVAILGLNRVREQAVQVENGIAFHRHMTFSLSFDHRVVDGADAARFLTTLESYLESASDLIAD